MGVIQYEKFHFKFRKDDHEIVKEKLEALQDLGLEAYRIHLNDLKENISYFLDSDILIVAIPFKDVVAFQKFVLEVEKSPIKKVIFISSTSVYSDAPLTTFRVTESTKPNPETESGKQLLESETVLQSNTNFKTTVIRFGGLIGEGRHPIHFLAGRKNIENPDAPINLIHQKDCIGIIKAVIEQNCFGETFNAEITLPYETKKQTMFHLL